MLSNGLCKIEYGSENTGFLWSSYFRISAKLKNSPLYWKIMVKDNLHSSVFCAVMFLRHFDLLTKTVLTISHDYAVYYFYLWKKITCVSCYVCIITIKPTVCCLLEKLDQWSNPNTGSMLALILWLILLI